MSSFERFIGVVRSPGFFLVWLGLAVLSYFLLDQRIALYFQPHDSWLYTVCSWVEPLGYPSYYVPLLVVLALVGHFSSRPRLRNGSVFVLVAVVVTALVQNTLKVVLGKARPSMLFENEQFGFFFFQTTNDFWSLPSGLVTTVTAVLLATAFVLPRYWRWLVAAVVVLSLTRVVVTAHFLSDVMAALYIMFMIVIWLADWFGRRGWLAPSE